MRTIAHLIPLALLLSATALVFAVSVRTDTTQQQSTPMGLPRPHSMVAANATPTPVREQVHGLSSAPTSVAFAVTAVITTDAQAAQGPSSGSRLEVSGQLEVDVHARHPNGLDVGLRIAQAEVRMDNNPDAAGDALLAGLAAHLATQKRCRLGFDGSVDMAPADDPATDLLRRIVASMPLVQDPAGEQEWVREATDRLGHHRVGYRRIGDTGGGQRIEVRHLGYTGADAVRSSHAHSECSIDADRWLRSGEGEEQLVLGLAAAGLVVRTEFHLRLERTAVTAVSDAAGPTVGELLAAFARLRPDRAEAGGEFDALVERLAALAGRDAAAFAATAAAVEAGDLAVAAARGAILALGRSRAPGAPGFLVDHLGNATARTEQRLAAAEAIQGLGIEDTTRRSCSAAFACPDEARTPMLRALLGLVPAGAEQATLDTLLRAEADVAGAGGHAAWVDAVGRLDSAAAMTVIQARLVHDDPAVRGTAVAALARRGGPDIALRLQERLAVEQHASVRVTTLRGLAAAATDDQIPLVAAALRTEANGESRIEALAELAHPRRLRPAAIALLRELATADRDPDVREAARLALGGSAR